LILVKDSVFNSPRFGAAFFSHLIHGVFFAIGEMLGMNKITGFFIALGGVLLVVGAMLLAVFVMTSVV